MVYLYMFFLFFNKTALILLYYGMNFLYYLFVTDIRQMSVHHMHFESKYKYHKSKERR